MGKVIIYYWDKYSQQTGAHIAIDIPEYQKYLSFLPDKSENNPYSPLKIYPGQFVNQQHDLESVNSFSRKIELELQTKAMDQSINLLKSELCNEESCWQPWQQNGSLASFNSASLLLLLLKIGGMADSILIKSNLYIDKHFLKAFFSKREFNVVDDFYQFFFDVNKDINPEAVFLLSEKAYNHQKNPPNKSMFFYNITIEPLEEKRIDVRRAHQI